MIYIYLQILQFFYALLRYWLPLWFPILFYVSKVVKVGYMIDDIINHNILMIYALSEETEQL